MSKAGPKNNYCVPPLHVHDHVTQCAAHFLNWFRSSSPEHIRSVLRCGLKGTGGLVDEVDYWFQNCLEDASEPSPELGYWDAAEDGPWTYDTLSVAEVAKVVWDHSRGWKPVDFAWYGYTTSHKAETEDPFGASRTHS
ncbi:hypothetical protein [Rhizobium ruizarguesonis]|uniref:hypothetical protein n=1 Tax=Rhizobium ruizarguesonis TaxID=2081791 RepID=UPI001444A63D|nr:hypothetical protein [Rhizobium ruizarguesonis]NKQ87476.1 hypothetical protein [Rhizobium ruizarguesonis]